VSPLVDVSSARHINKSQHLARSTPYVVEDPWNRANTRVTPVTACGTQENSRPPMCVPGSIGFRLKGSGLFEPDVSCWLFTVRSSVVSEPT
jgi:hypothetical protein